MKDHFPLNRKAGHYYDNQVIPRAARKRGDPEDMPTRESMHPKGQGWREGGGHRMDKTLTKFLMSRVGSLWDKVYSEICHGTKDPEVRHWVKKYLVKLDTFIDRDGDVAYLDAYYGWSHRKRGREVKIKTESDIFWVHPQTRVLHYAPHFRERTAKPRQSPYRYIDGRYYLSVGGIWYTADIGLPTAWDDMLARCPDLPTLPAWQTRVSIYSGTTLVKGNQLGSRALKTLGLMNSPPEKKIPNHIEIQQKKRFFKSLT